MEAQKTQAVELKVQTSNDANVGEHTIGLNITLYEDDGVTASSSRLCPVSLTVVGPDAFPNLPEHVQKIRDEKAVPKPKFVGNDARLIERSDK